jgi:hypothetical protein
MIVSGPFCRHEGGGRKGSTTSATKKKFLPTEGVRRSGGEVPRPSDGKQESRSLFNYVKVNVKRCFNGIVVLESADCSADFVTKMTSPKHNIPS